MQATTYSKPFTISVCMHLCLLALMFMHPHSSTQAVLEAKEHSKIPMEMAKPAEQAPIQAVAVDAAEVEAAMHQLQAQKEAVKQQEIAHQRQLAAEAERARQAKMAEMKRLKALQEEAKQVAIKQEQMKQEAQKHLQELAKQKEVQEKQLAAMKQKQEEESKRLAALEKQKQAELAKAAAAKAAEVKAQALATAQRQAGEVDKYKALILNAIRDRWILPENVDPNLSSQFSIHLAPTGAVLDVHLTRSSGDSILDRSAQAAIYKASPLPVPQDSVTFNLFREISLTVRPSNARG